MGIFTPPQRDQRSDRVGERQIWTRRKGSIRGHTYAVVSVLILSLLAAAAIIVAPGFSTAGVDASAEARSSTPAPVDPPVTTPPRVSPTPIKAPSINSAPLLDGLAYSQSLAANRVIMRGTISPRAGGYSETFQYERANNLERMQVAGGNFVRKIDAGWVRTNGWSTTGTPASPTQTSMLNDLIAMTKAAWSARSAPGAITALPASKEESNFKVIYSMTTQSSAQQMFTFRKTNAHLQLERFSGLVGTGPDQVQLTVDYGYADSAAAPPPTPSPKPTPRPAARKSRAKSRTRAARRNAARRTSPTPATPSPRPSEKR